ncbi:JmjC domain-containing protein [Micromonospora echinospora]
MTHDPILTQLVGDKGAFARDHWGRTPILRRGAWRDATADLFGVTDVLATLTGSALRPPHVRLVKGGRPVPAERFTHAVHIAHGIITDAVDPERLLSEFRQGATLMLDSFEDHSPRVQEACRSLSRSLRCPVDSYVFITPPGEKGLELHYDIKDVFVVQLVGSKNWKVYSQVRPTPDESKVLPGVDLGMPEVDTRLEPGDVLYVPKGTPHIAAAPDVFSVHISFAAKPHTWAALLRLAADNALQLPAFESVPNVLAADPDVIRTDLISRLEQVREVICENLSAGAEAILDAGIAQRPALDTVLGSLALLATRDEGLSILRRRPIEVSQGGDDRILVRTTGSAMTMPGSCRSAVELLAKRDTVQLAELTEHLQIEASLTLLGHLVQYGAVSIGAGGRP